MNHVETSMRDCKVCGCQGVKVVDSRRMDGLGVRTTWRRRECENCETRWTTYEIDSEIYKWFKGLWEVLRGVSQ